jgi:hypothetical protein
MVTDKTHQANAVDWDRGRPRPHLLSGERKRRTIQVPYHPDRLGCVPAGEGAGAPSEKVEFAVTALEFKLPSPLLSAAALGAWESRFSPDIIDPRTITVIT